MIELRTPITNEAISNLQVGDLVSISGKIFCGRDAVLPKLCTLIKKGKLQEYGIDLQGSVVFHTAVSPAGIGPTSSNKLEIEESFPELAKAGVKIHLGKGKIKKETIEILDANNSAFAVIPPVTALLAESTVSQRCIAFSELGMEALYELEVENFQAIIGAVHNKSIYDD